MNNPMINMLFKVMQSRGINIPSNVNMNNPQEIVNYLLQSGKISQDQYNRAYQTYRNIYGNGMNNPQQSN